MIFYHLWLCYFIIIFTSMVSCMLWFSFKDESNLIDKIVKEVLWKLSCRCPPNELRGLIGIEVSPILNHYYEKYKQLGSGVWVESVKPPSLKRYLTNFPLNMMVAVFLANVREEWEKHGINHLRNYLLSKILDHEDLHFSIPKVGTSFVMIELKRKKVLIVLDDVNASE